MSFETLCVHGKSDYVDCTGAVSVPIYQSATFAHPGVGESTGFDYTRLQNPTRERLEEVMAALENGSVAIAFASGMAAITAVLSIFEPGSELIVTEDLYGGTVRLFHQLERLSGLSFRSIDTTDSNQIEAAVCSKTRALYIETPSNPMMQITDISEAAAIARRHGLLLIVDNTFLSPYFQKPLDLGADIVIHSGTKFLSGHNDTLCGFAVTQKEALAEKIRYTLKTTGACLSPWDSWLTLRGIKTLAVRLDRQQQNASILADWLTRQPEITQVYYPGLATHPQYDIIKKQSSGFGAMISMRTDTPERARAILAKAKLILYAESLGGVESLITYPILQTHADVPEEQRNKLGIDDCLLRLSVGLENIDDLIADLEQAIRSN